MSSQIFQLGPGDIDEVTLAWIVPVHRILRIQYWAEYCENLLSTSISSNLPEPEPAPGVCVDAGLRDHLDDGAERGSRCFVCTTRGFRAQHAVVVSQHYNGLGAYFRCKPRDKFRHLHDTLAMHLGPPHSLSPEIRSFWHLRTRVFVSLPHRYLCMYC